METKQKELLKKMLVFTGLGVIFALSLWFIFKPSKKAQEIEQKGINQTIPQASTEKLRENKLKAYELDAKTEKAELSQDKLGKLSDYFEGESKEERKNTKELPESKIEHSIQRYEENNRLVSSFYEPDPREEEIDQLHSEIDALREELSQRNKLSEEEEEKKQLALMEKSYQMAAKYLPAATTNGMSPNAFTTAQQQPMADKSEVLSSISSAPSMEVLAERKQVVSSLDQPMSNKAFMEEYGTQQRNMGFYSLATATTYTTRNTLKVVVDRTTTLKEGDYVALRLLETARIKDLRIPRQSKLIAQAKIEGNRMRLLIKSIEVDGHISPVKLSAYDTDGQEGIYIPASEDISALKEMGANIGGSMGTSFTFASSAKDQIISEAARGVIQGASQLLQKKLHTVKVTLKGGYRLFLVQTQ